MNNTAVIEVSVEPGECVAGTAPLRALLDAPVALAETIDAQLPEFAERCEAVAEAILALQLVDPPTAWEARASLPALFTQLTNELLDLLYDAAHGRGRTALKGARSLFELLMALRDCLSTDPHGAAADRRYVRHLAVGQQIEARLTLERDALPKKERRALQHRQRKLARDSKAAYDTAIAEYGRNYQRGWAAKSLADRATAQGLLTRLVWVVGSYTAAYRTS